MTDINHSHLIWSSVSRTSAGFYPEAANIREHCACEVKDVSLCFCVCVASCMYHQKSSCQVLMQQQDGTGGERQSWAAADEDHSGEGSNWIKFSTIRFWRLLTGEKAQYFSLSTNLLQSSTTPMQPQPQLYAVNNKQIYFHQPC